jgi:hypothetical protein
LPNIFKWHGDCSLSLQWRLRQKNFNQRSVDMRKIAVAIALAMGTTLALAADDTKKVEPKATGDKAVTGSPTPQQGQPAGSDTAGAFWTEHARDGYMTKEQAMKYKGADGKAMDFKKLDADNDGRVSQSEWQKHTSFAQKEGGPKEKAGAAGPAPREPAPPTK